MPKVSHRENNFDIDLKFGEGGESAVAEMLEGAKVEVKTEDEIWRVSGNIAIEIKYKGKPSGLSATDADTWIHLLNSNGHLKKGFIFSVDWLRSRVKTLHSQGKVKICEGGDGNNSTLVLIPISLIFDERSS